MTVDAGGRPLHPRIEGGSCPLRASPTGGATSLRSIRPPSTPHLWEVNSSVGAAERRWLFRANGLDVGVGTPTAMGGMNHYSFCPFLRGGCGKALAFGANGGNACVDGIQNHGIHHSVLCIYIHPCKK